MINHRLPLLLKPFPYLALEDGEGNLTRLTWHGASLGGLPQTLTLGGLLVHMSTYSASAHGQASQLGQINSSPDATKWTKSVTNWWRLSPSVLKQKSSCYIYVVNQAYLSEQCEIALFSWFITAIWKTYNLDLGSYWSISVQSPVLVHINICRIPTSSELCMNWIMQENNQKTLYYRYAL